MVAIAVWAALLSAQAVQGLSEEGRARVVGIRPEKTEVKVGETFKVAFDLEITPEWYIYPTFKTTSGKPTTFVMEGAEVAGKVEEPKTKTKTEEGLEPYEIHQGKITLTVPLRLKPGPSPGPFEVKGRVEGQICKDVCKDLKTPFALQVKVVEGTVTPAAAPSAEYEAQGGFLGLILLGMLGGLISLIMPCTYPLIPITLTYFVKQAAGSRQHGLALSTVYSLGIIVTFTGLGFLLSVLLGPGGARTFAADPWVNIVVGLLFLWFTGGLFGFYEIQLPFGLGQKLAGGQRKGVGGAFILGLLFAVVTFTCTIPIAGTILSLAAGQHRFAAGVAMLFYSVTMAVPFFLMGAFPGMIREVPKSGGWLTTVKVSMAWVELALAIFYFGKSDQAWEFNVITRWVVLAGYTGACLVVALYLLRYFRERLTLARVGFAAVFLLLGGYTGYGLVAGKRLGLLETVVLPPPTHGTTMPAALTEAKKQGKPLFAEFTGIT